MKAKKRYEQDGEWSGSMRRQHSSINQRSMFPSSSNVTRETKNWNVCESKLETWNWKFEVGIAKGATMNTWKG